MKTSIKLLIGLALSLVIAMFGAAVSIHHQFDSIDQSDTYSRWQKKQLPLFHAVQITGPSAAIVQIEPGNTTRLLIDSLGQYKKPTYTYQVERDTLFLQINPAEGWFFRVDDEDDEWRNPQLVVQVPTLRAVSTVNANCQIHNFKGDVLTLTQGGKGGSTSLDHLTYDQLNASLSEHNQLTFPKFNNGISKAAITLGDSSRLFQYSDFKQGLTLTASPTAKLRLTGKALQQVQQ
ncbi:hypothetical protein [Fibrella forsythiae]|uniref:Auto-transporter adhesin head GIN domain-containing protein n=1 Tax=Fibrella forsythiae TaxID=2817061 RepID=A0ABS3JDG0_9BACT|nr:hypothetical protein [Fibrella forsythiae]MBO0948036.1 hypothetical protein [Fibrella forsythiae]